MNSLTEFFERTLLKLASTLRTLFTHAVLHVGILHIESCCIRKCPLEFPNELQVLPDNLLLLVSEIWWIPIDISATEVFYSPISLFSACLLGFGIFGVRRTTSITSYLERMGLSVFTIKFVLGPLGLLRSTFFQLKEFRKKIEHWSVAILLTVYK